jgi:hypothetical protein
MSTTTFEFTHRVNGTLTDATSVVMSDPTGAFGARRTDTAATVVADGTAMTRISAGVYQYELTDPAAGLTYEWWAEYTYDGITNRAEFTEAGGSGEAEASTGDYVDFDRYRDWYGELNAALRSRLERDDTETEDSSVMLAHAGKVNRRVDRLARARGWDTPIDTEHADYEAVRDAATDMFADSIARAYDPDNRGDTDNTPDDATPLKGEADLLEILGRGEDGTGATDAGWIPTGVTVLETAPVYPWQPDYRDN